MPWDDGLTGALRNIAETNASPLRVMAGPGTGKSFAMKRRVQRLLEDGVDPGVILACTFTRTAAADLRKDLENLGVPGSKDIKASTLHSLCFAMLLRRHVLVATGRVPRPLLDFETEFMLADPDDARFGGKRERRKRLRAFNAAWARLQSEEPGWLHDPVDRAFHAALQDWLVFHRAVLIGELVPLALRYLQDNPASEELYRYAHVLVDEYQDLNKAEQIVTDLLASSGSIAIIGDEDQSIYSFKHAHPEGIVDFHTSRPGTHDESLDVCLRCPTSVVEMAKHLISQNRNRQPRQLHPFPSNPTGDVHIVQWSRMSDEVEGISAFVRDQVIRGMVEAGNVLILAPTRNFGYRLRDRLKELGVHSVSYFTEEALRGRPGDLTASQNQQAMTLTRLLADPEDRVAIRAWCGFGRSSLWAPAWRRLMAHCRDQKLSPRAALEQLDAGTIRLPYTTGLIDRYRDLQDELAWLDGLTGEDLVDALFPDGEEWSTPFRELTAGIEDEDYDAGMLETTLRGGIAHQEIPEEVDFVRVMSMHKSKGLTADLVVVLGCIEGLMPRIPDDLNAHKQARALEEQRRLFYVGITRTRQRLVLSSITSLPRADAHRMGARVIGGNPTVAATISSRFTRELGPTRPTPIRGEQFLRNMGLT